MTSPWAEARVEAELDWGNIDTELRTRLERSVAVATRQCQRHFTELQRHATRQAAQISRDYDKAYRDIASGAARTAAQVRSSIESASTDVEIGIDDAGAMAQVKTLRSRLAAEAAKPIDTTIDVELEGEQSASARLAALARDRTANIKVDVDRRASAMIGRIGSSIGKLGGSVMSVTGTIGKFTAIAGVAVVALGALVPVVGALGSALYAVGGAAAGAGVAGLFGLIAVAGTLKTAFSGVGEAAKNMFDPEKAAEFEEALSKLSPAAQETLRSVQSLGKSFKDIVTMDVQESFFSGLGPHIEQLQRYLPGIRASMLQVADGFNEGAKSALSFMNSADGMKTIGTLLTESGNMAGNFGSALGNLVPGLLSIGASATRVFGPMTNGIAGASRRLSEFLNTAHQTGRMDQWFRTMVDSAKQFGQVLGELGGAIGGVFRAAATAGGGNPMAG